MTIKTTLTPEDIIAHILEEADHRASHTGYQDPGLALTAKAKEKKNQRTSKSTPYRRDAECYKCGKRGHYASKHRDHDDTSDKPNYWKEKGKIHAKVAKVDKSSDDNDFYALIALDSNANNITHQETPFERPTIDDEHCC
ncbi:hypothetical protein SERLADRAFT_441918 [Serpula lacrymans var. lacrymans S7.9]|uniref:CCHC-type domain-containing protein n=1 Tax=Serpula lacrymans var. lacrymans (strain S7.9) TaxID=578457 RepID=F8P818_SERL9|nr:uncharacterized protein SERLADRAFT_441918 [Serpula lacrymans var. lacrymans S7.9]EGO20576.1 hypothetical protein SERLADRAFT_441918 [Serpula lacrymans var. lacrymans S7.9]